MERPRRLLVTGFGPFPRVPHNPSAALAMKVAASPRLRLNGIEAKAVVLTTAYATLASELNPLLAENPDLVLLLGVAGRSAKVRVEGRATSRRSTLFPDVRGDLPNDLEACARGEPVRRTRVNAVAALAALERHGLAARPSRDAGRYLCNAAYYRALGGAAPTLFIHIPKTPKSRGSRSGRKARPPGSLLGARWQVALRRALVDISLDMAKRARCVAARAALR